MPQYGRPDGDISVGSWAPFPADPTTLFDKINEEIHDSDTTYIVSSTDEDVCEFSLTDLTDPISSINHTLRCYARSVAGGGAAEQFKMLLYENGNLRAESGVFNASKTGYQVYEYTLSAGEADSIGNYANLRIRLWITKTDPDEPIRITQADFRVPDAAVEVLVSGTISAISGLAGLSKVDRKILGSISGISGVDGSAKVARKVSGSISGISGVSGSVKVIRKIAGTISAVSTITGNAIIAAGEVLVSGTISAISGLSGVVKVVRKVAGSISGVSGASGTTKVTRKISGQISGVSSITGKVTGVFTLIGSISGLSNFLGKLVKIGEGVGFHFLSHLLEHLKGHKESR